jgi:hypothetical protein
MKITMSHCTWAMMVVISVIVLTLISMIGIIKMLIVDADEIACIIETSMAVHHPQTVVVATLEDCDLNS